MTNFIKLIDPYRWLIGGVVVASVVGAFLWYRGGLIQQGIDREKAAVAVAVAEQKALADAQTKNLQGVANEAQDQYQKDMEASRLALERTASSLARMRSKAASAEQLAGASREAASDYAADAERSVDFCAERLSRTGTTAGEASAAAYALYNAWPNYQVTRPDIDKYRLTLRKATP